MPRLGRLWYVSLALVAAACSANAAGPDGELPDAGLPDASDPDASEPSIDALRALLLQKIDASACPSEPCPRATVTARPAPETAASRGRRILLIDDAIVLPAVTRWPSRVIGVLALGADGSYAEATPAFTMARDALDVFAAIPPAISGLQLDVSAQFFGRFAQTIPAEAFGHGMDILPFLAERIPDSQFVVSEDQLDAPAPCELLDAAPDDPAWAAHDAFVGRMASTLASVITSHGINYVHLSWGIGYSELSRTFQARCGGIPSVDVARRYMEPYVALLSAWTALQTPDAAGRLRPVVVFQAGASGVDPDASRLDCADIAHRVRVFSVAYTGTAVPPGGSHDESLLPTSLAQLGCNDIFVVMGYTSIFSPPRGDAYFPSMPFGLGRAPRPSWPPAPSFANPIGLARFVRIAEDHPDESTDDWSLRLTDGWTKPIIDPLLYDPDQLPAPH